MALKRIGDNSYGSYYQVGDAWFATMPCKAVLKQQGKRESWCVGFIYREAVRCATEAEAKAAWEEGALSQLSDTGVRELQKQAKVLNKPIQHLLDADAEAESLANRNRLPSGKRPQPE